MNVDFVMLNTLRSAVRRCLLGVGLAQAVLSLTPSGAFAQNAGRADAHSALRAGDEAFGRKDFGAAELHYRRAEEQAPSFQSAYNLGVTLGYLDRPKEAATAFKQARERAESPREAGDASFNGGTANMSQQELQASIQNFSDALRSRPNDEAARYNLSHALRQLRRQQEEQQKQNQDQQNQQQQQQQQEQQQQQPPQENQQQPRQGEQPPKQDPQESPEASEQPKDEPGEPNTPSQPNPNAIPKDEVERLLRIAADQERRTNEKMKLGKSAPSSSGKDW